MSDAPSLFAMLTPEEVSRFISPPPTTVEGFERFITWARAERAAGRYVCFAVVPHGMTTAIGLFQVRQLEAGLRDRRMGLRASAPSSGARACSSMAAELVVDFAVETLGVRRLEARAAVANGRGNGALRKLGAVQEGVLRRSFLKNGAASGSDAVVDPRRGMASGESRLGERGRSLAPAVRLPGIAPVQ